MRKHWRREGEGNGQDEGAGYAELRMGSTVKSRVLRSAEAKMMRDCRSTRKYSEGGEERSRIRESKTCAIEVFSVCI